MKVLYFIVIKDNMPKYQIDKVLNNNIVQCTEIGKDIECMVLGKGIGFQKVRGERIDSSLIEKIYFVKDKKNITRYQQLVEQCDDSLVEVVEDVIHQMELKFGDVYDEYLHIALLDHLNFSIYRMNNNIEVKNIFLEEFSIMYSEEYAFAKAMLEYINKQLSIDLPYSEVGFITLHIHSAIHEESVSKSALYMQIISECVQHIENQLQMHLDPCSLERMRLVTHLKFALERAKKQIELDNPVLNSLKNSYPKTFEIAQSLGEMLEREFDVHLYEGELGYLALHIQNIINAVDKKGERVNDYTR